MKSFAKELELDNSVHNPYVPLTSTMQTGVKEQ
jgi:hypothetical protein